MKPLEKSPSWQNYAVSAAIHLAVAAILMTGFFLTPASTGSAGGASETLIEIGSGGLEDSLEDRVVKGAADGTVDNRENAPEEKLEEPEVEEGPVEEPMKEETEAPGPAPVEEATPEEPEPVSEETVPVEGKKPEPEKKVEEKKPVEPEPAPKSEKKTKVKPEAKKKPAPRPAPHPEKKAGPEPASSAPDSSRAGDEAAPDAPGGSSLVGSGRGVRALEKGPGDAGLVDNGDGTYSVSGRGSLHFTILEDAKAEYPAKARSIGFDKSVRVKVKFLVGLDGRVENARVLTQRLPPLGFDDEALRAIRRMRFEPIRLAGAPVRVYFVKRIIFTP